MDRKKTKLQGSVKDLQKEQNSGEWRHQDTEQQHEAIATVLRSKTRERAENGCAQGVNSSSSYPEDSQQTGG